MLNEMSQGKKDKGIYDHSHVEYKTTELANKLKQNKWKTWKKQKETNTKKRIVVTRGEGQDEVQKGQSDWRETAVWWWMGK